MPTNEKLLEWGICPRCEYHIITMVEWTEGLEHSEWWSCARCEYTCFASDFLPLDTLQQMFALWKTQELETFRAGITLCAEAKRRGITSILAQYRGYTTRSINRLAALEGLPAHLWSPELSQGVYWEALKMASDDDNVDLDKFAELIEEAICNQWSLKEFKEAHGIVGPDRRQPVFDGVAELVEAGEYKFTNREVKVY